MVIFISSVLSMMRAVLLYIALKMHMEGRGRQRDVVQSPVLTLFWIQLGQMCLFCLVSGWSFLFPKDSMYLLCIQNRALFSTRYCCAAVESHKLGTCVSRLSTLRLQPSCWRWVLVLTQPLWLVSCFCSYLLVSVRSGAMVAPANNPEGSTQR